MPSILATLLLLFGLGGCTYFEPPGEPLPEISDYDFDYVVGPGDSLNIFVWRNPELSTTATVRPDGKITVPLVEDLVVTGKTSTELAREMESVLSRYVRDPLVTVMVSGFNGVASEQIRVLGEATNPTTLPYEADM
ncbi:MAG: polysaccharide biosynthesis/export family protein, partial [Gammaproteobacteria bacterium]|nr:polysaccharide biosynthesis/export family protein [Gammaproteobacteria bacterium]